MRTVLVTGGAGYIGSHIVEQLLARGDTVIILDMLVYGQPWPIVGQSRKSSFTQQGSFQASPTKGEFIQVSSVITGTLFCIQGQVGDAMILDSIFSRYAIDAVVHCAALIEVGASVKEPLSFYNTNVSQTLVLLDRMKAHNVYTLVFSSSASVYGTPGVDLITENASTSPLNPYGQSKLFIERVLADCAQAYGLCYAALRYFNVAGAYPEKDLGERHEPETHVVPLLLRAAEKGSTFNLYSADYGTVDGTCIRDYVHVRDIARANLLALDAVSLGSPSFTFNIGSGKGLSVLDLVREVERVTHKKIATRVVERRSGDAARLVADATLAEKLLGWRPLYSLEKMLLDAYAFCLNNKSVVTAVQQPCKTLEH